MCTRRRLLVEKGGYVCYCYADNDGVGEGGRRMGEEGAMQIHDG